MVSSLRNAKPVEEKAMDITTAKVLNPRMGLGGWWE